MKTDSLPDKNEEIIPPHHEGSRKDVDYFVDAVDENDARKLFMTARNRLVNVNHWQEYATPLSATFRLTDLNGNEVDRTAETGDHFKIDLPAPAPKSGSGFDWVRIEAIEDRSNPDGADEFMAIRVRPASDPKSNSDEVAHFFTAEATSSFVLERHGTKVKAAVYGRNEQPNTETPHVIDKVRNALVGATAIAGLSNIQWKNLMIGLLKTSE
jgi:hypothetical protein